MRPYVFATCALSLCALPATSAGAQTATYSDISDALMSRCYDASTTAPDASDGNRLVIGVHSGFSSSTWQNSACIASTASFSPRQTMDTVSFLVEAPAGFALTSIHFAQGGGTSSSRGGQAFAGATWVVDDIAETIPGSGGWSASVDLSGEELTIVPVSITTFLGAGAAGQAGSASASASDPVVWVDLEPTQPQLACGLLGIEPFAVLLAASVARRRRSSP